MYNITPPTHLHRQEQPALLGSCIWDVLCNTNTASPLKSTVLKCYQCYTRGGKKTPGWSSFLYHSKACQGDTCITAITYFFKVKLILPLSAMGGWGILALTTKDGSNNTQNQKSGGKKTSPTDWKYNPVFVCSKPVGFHMLHIVNWLIRKHQ